MSNIKVVEQKVVELYNDELLAVRSEDNQVFVSVNQMCEALGIAPVMQRRRIRDHEILSEGYSLGTVITEGGEQQAALLRVDMIPLWLIGIQISKVREDVRPKLKLFIRRAASVLSEAFQEGRLTADSEFEALLEHSDSGAVEAYRMLQAMVKMARNQILLEARLDTHDDRLNSYEKRLEEVEITLGDPGHYVMPDQAMQISQAVKAIAIVLGKESKRNEFGSVYGELYRIFGVPSYKMIPASRFEEAMDFLTTWYQDITGDLPF
jgi:hypothetical protein